MSMSAGASGAYGILLAELKQPEVIAICKKLDEAISDWDMETPPYEEDIPEVLLLAEDFKAFLESIGVEAPAGAALLWTGSEDDRPARCGTPAESWVFGYGLFSYNSPNDYPKMEKSFTDLSEWHTWVWVG